ncbi:MAG TPA: hypothetical protein VN749_11765 [Candidatus Eisenbacteria bacterium]|jgi:hypothetical protein|nr:hypothetical protein [Candidatus Eisenbacteria bacterium]
MARGQSSASDTPAQLAEDLVQTLTRERVIPRFVDSYVVENGRHALQVHAPLYRDLLTILQREALLAACVRALEIATFESVENSRGKQRVVMRKGAESFRRRFLSALARQQNWNAGDSLDFQSDLKMYQDLLARAASSRRPRKPYEAANHPFVDRCAFMLDSDFLEKARLAASRALTSVEEIAAKLAREAVGKC